MRRTMLVGAVLAVVAFLVVIVSNWLDLELDSVAMVGIALGAVVALVPDRSPLMRLAGFAAGIVLAWIGFLLRAAVLPDTYTGRALGLGLVILLCTVVAAATATRVPLWSTLVGAAALSGAYEYTFAAAMPEVTTTSVTAVTALVLTSAVGFLVVALLAPGTPAEETERPAPRPKAPRADDNDTTKLDEMMEKTP
ncbi:MAG: hypothetical protein ACTHKG_16515 [Nocardioides sp.]